RLRAAPQGLLRRMAPGEMQAVENPAQVLVELRGARESLRDRYVVHANEVVVVVEDRVAFIAEHAPAEPEIGQRALVLRHLRGPELRLLQRLVGAPARQQCAGETDAMVRLGT